MKVEVFGRPLCESCERFTNYLDSQLIPYNYINVEYLSSDELNEYVLKRTTNRALPIVFVNDNEVKDLDEFKRYFRNEPNTETTGELGSSRVY